MPIKNSPSTNLSHLHLLLIEDNLIAQRIEFEMLQALDCKVTLATNGKQALELLQQDSYQLVFADCSLPDISIYDLSQQLLLLHPNTPLIALAQSLDEHDYAKASGLKACLFRPLTTEKCRRLLVKLLF